LVKDYDTERTGIVEPRLCIRHPAPVGVAGMVLSVVFQIAHCLEEAG
jgi:hypothetical protein